MSLINCPECGKQISNTCNSCINCGFNLNQNIQQNSAQTINSYNTTARKDRIIFSQSIAINIMNITCLSIGLLIFLIGRPLGTAISLGFSIVLLLELIMFIKTAICGYIIVDRRGITIFWGFTFTPWANIENVYVKNNYLVIQLRRGGIKRQSLYGVKINPRVIEKEITEYRNSLNY